MQRLGLWADSFKRWWWELVRVAKIMWGIIMKEASSSSLLLSSLSWAWALLSAMVQRHLVQNWPSHLEVRRSTRAFLPPINSLDPAGHKTSRAPRAWHVPKGCGTSKTTHMPKLGDSLSSARKRKREQAKPTPVQCLPPCRSKNRSIRR
jgi:hypothetical protein